MFLLDLQEYQMSWDIKKENGKKIDTEGELYYRGVKVSDFIKGHDPKNRFLFEEVCF